MSEPTLDAKCKVQNDTKSVVLHYETYSVTEASRHWEQIVALIGKWDKLTDKTVAELQMFRDRKGYKGLGYNSWELFCSKKLSLTSRWINTKISKALPPPKEPKKEDPEPDEPELNSTSKEQAPPDPPEPDPWQEKKREVRDVYARVNASLKQLKETLQWARGHNVFDFASTVVEQDVGNIVATILLSKPVAECPDCHAQTPKQAKNCRTCKTIGLVPKHYANRGR